MMERNPAARRGRLYDLSTHSNRWRRFCGGHALVPGKLARIKELIESRLDGDLSLAILARESGYSRAHFARSFHATTGMTVHRYVLERRMQRAKYLLGIKGDSNNLAAVAAAAKKTST